MSGEQVDGEVVPMGLCGLDNPTASVCYFNTGLQCLYACTQLRTFILDGEFHRLLPDPINSFLEAFEQQLGQMHFTARNCTDDLRREFYQLHPAFSDTSSHYDTHEMLMATINSLHEGLNRPTPERPVPIRRAPVQAATEWKAIRRRNQTPIFDMFFGLMKSSLLCDNCGHVSVTCSEFSSLQLIIPPDTEPPTTLEDCLKLTFRVEQLDDVECALCRSNSFEKRTEIARLPPLLIVSFVRMADSTRKIDTPITYPLRDLNMSRWCARGCPHRADLYDLIAVATHSGSLRSGHNTAIVHNPTVPHWLEFSDQQIDPRRIEEVVTPLAYVLIYERS